VPRRLAALQPRQADVRRRQRGIFLNRLLELRLGFGDAPFELVQRHRAIAPQLGRQPAKLHGARVRGEEARVDLARKPHAERRQGEIRLRQPDKRAAVGRRRDGRLFEAVDRAIEALVRPAMPEVPAGAARARPIAALRCGSPAWPVDDPRAEFAEAPADFADRDVHVWRETFVPFHASSIICS